MSLSVIIPNYNGRTLLEANLPAVLDACVHWSPEEKQWEVIVVDDASKDLSNLWLQQNYPSVKVVTNPRNLRFARAVNRGVQSSSGDIVVILNNDVTPAKDFIAPLLEPFTDKNVFAVGCLETNLVEGKNVSGGRGLGKFTRGFLTHRRAQNQSLPSTLWVSAGSGAFRKSIWDKLGGFDPLFRPAYEEDRDLSYNALKSGYKILFAPHSRVFHIHETSNLQTFGKNRIKIMSFKNQLLFVWKNISSSQYLLQHLFWLPYHLLFTTIKTKGLFLLGFLGAINQLPEALSARFKAKKLWQFSDEQIINSLQK